MRGIVKTRYIYLALGLAVLSLATTSIAQAADGDTSEHNVALTFLWIAIILLVAKFSSLVERFSQPAVLGELVIGVILGNLFLVGVDIFEPIKEDSLIVFLAEFGVVILLFQIGLESNIDEMRRVGLRAFLVAVIGIVIPFGLGTYVVGPLLLPDFSSNVYLFLGATLTATSVGITARVFRDLGKLQSSEAQIVLGAAVIDDVLGLIVLAVVSGIVISGTISAWTVGQVILTAILFLIGAVVIGQLLAPRLGNLFSKINAGIGMKFTLALSFCLIFAYLAKTIGLEPIVGAFAAGLVLESVHFRNFKDQEIIDDMRETFSDTTPEIKKPIWNIIENHSDRHVEELLEPLGYTLVPIFFVITGMNVRLDSLFNPQILLIASGITVLAFISKIVTGLVAGGKVNKWIVGWGMVPRGEVGLIFAAVGQRLGVVSDEIFSVIVIMVIFTTLLSPPVLALLLRRWEARQLS